MNIHEYQAKEILKNFGIDVPNGIIIYSLAEIDQKMIKGMSLYNYFCYIFKTIFKIIRYKNN